MLPPDDEFKAKIHQILPLGNLQRSPRPPSWIWGPLRGRGGAGLGKRRERGGKGREQEVEWREREGPQVTVEPGPLRALLRHCPLTYNYLISSGNTYILGKDAYLVVSHAFHPKTAEFHGSPFWGILLYLCLHILTKNNQIRHGNTMVRGVF